jgi:hypothetical protein
MSRIASGDVVIVKPSNNVYTVLLAIATVVQILGLIVIFLRFTQVFGANIFNS